jgi:hypothetical protein
MSVIYSPEKNMQLIKIGTQTMLARVRLRVTSQNEGGNLGRMVHQLAISERTNMKPAYPGINKKHCVLCNVYEA